MKKKNQTTKKITMKAWAVVSLRHGGLIAYAPAPKIKVVPEPIAIYETEEKATQAVRESNKYLGKRYNQKIPCTITYELHKSKVRE